MPVSINILNDIARFIAFMEQYECPGKRLIRDQYIIELVEVHTILVVADGIHNPVHPSF